MAFIRYYVCAMNNDQTAVPWIHTLVSIVSVNREKSWKFHVLTTDELDVFVSVLPGKSNLCCTVPGISDSNSISLLECSSPLRSSK